MEKLAEIHKIEKKVTTLLKTGGDALSILSKEDPSFDLFKQYAGDYFQILEEIQQGLLSQVKNVNTSNISYIRNIHDQEKEFEIYLSSISFISDQIQQIIDETEAELSKE